MRVIANSILALSILISTQIQPATAGGATTQLVQLEQKYLGQTYTAEREDARVERLEKFVFGDVGLGDVNQRLAQLVTAANGGSSENNDADSLIENAAAFDNAPPTDSAPAYASTPEAAPSSDAASTGDVIGTEQQAPAGTNDNPDGGATPDTTGGSTDAYPRIGMIEKAVLGQPYPQQDVTARLAQLETKAFGKTSDSAALSDRVDDLEKYADKKYAKAMAAQRDKEVFDEDARGREIGPGQGSAVKSRVPGLVNMVSNALFGGPGMMGSPMNGGGAAMGGIGFGGVHMRDRAESAKQEALEAAQASESLPEARAAAQKDDPAVNSSSPPPATAKMLIKVSWCEVRLFGHTFTGMHLPERLQQINGELNFKPGKSGLALMDDVNGMIGAIAAKNPASKIGSAAPPVQ